MPAVDTVLLPLCVGLALLGVIFTGLAFRRGNKGRALQGVALALAPVALYFSGLLRLLWNGAVAVVTWASRIILSPAVWFGLSLLALCLVLWVVGAFVARRSSGKKKQVAAAPAGRGANGPAAVTGGAGRTQAQATKTPAAKTATGKKSAPAAAAKDPVDDDMAEIEALLKSRGID
jgi:hypothetical protein